MESGDFGQLVDTLIAEADGVVFADLAAVIENELGVTICFVPSSVYDSGATAEVWTRTSYMEIEWPVKDRRYQTEHFIFYDAKPSARAARLVAHELCHIWRHRPGDPSRKVDPETNLAHYEPEEEQEADYFSLMLLKKHPYLPGQTPPQSAQDMIALLDGQAGWTSWLTRDQAIAFINDLYSS